MEHWWNDTDRGKLKYEMKRENILWEIVGWRVTVFVGIQNICSFY
jgi:cyanate permease